VSCYGCGTPGHKKGDPACKAGKFDVHPSAPQDYKERMAKGKKREGDKKKPAMTPGKPGAKEGSKDKKHCHAFAFGKGTCRFGAKCRYLHEKGGGGDKAEPFSPEQKKLVTTLLSSAMKRTAAAIAKKNKQKEKKPSSKKRRVSRKMTKTSRPCWLHAFWHLSETRLRET
jgi:hypothetical protein